MSKSRLKKNYESVLKGLKIEVNEDNVTLKIDLPKENEKKKDINYWSLIKNKEIPMLVPETLPKIKSDDHQQFDYDNTSIQESFNEDSIFDEDNIFEETQEMRTITKKKSTNKSITRVKISFKAYIKIALHALKYAHPKESRTKWVEVIGLMTGFIENEGNNNECLNIQDAHPIGHGDAVTAQIQDPNSVVRVFNEKTEGHSIIGWYHSHPSYSPFMSQTDFETQYRYQKLAKGPINTQPVALVIDPTEISNSSYGFKFFRLKEDYRTWDEPKFEVIDTPVKTLPEMIETLLPLTVGKAVFLEYE